MRTDTIPDGPALPGSGAMADRAGLDAVSALTALGAASRQRDDVARAVLHYEEALALQLRLAASDHQEVARIREAIAVCLLRLERADEALAQRRSVLALMPSGTERATALNRAGEAAFIASHYREAADYYSDSLRVLRAALQMKDPIVAATLANYGATLAFLGHLDEAEQILREAIELDPELDAAKRMLGYTLSVAGQADEATNLSRQLRSRQPVLVMRTPLHSRGTVLVLGSEAGNIPARHLFGRLNATLIRWTTDFIGKDPREVLPAHDLVFNLVGDADDGEAALDRAAAYFAICPVPFLNPPDRVLKTKRDMMPARLASIDGLIVPRVVRREANGEDISGMLDGAGLRLPILLRKAGRHGGDSVELIQTEEELRAAWSHSGSCYMTEYHDYRSDDGFFRKYRVIFVDRQPFPYHLAISPDWLVHYFSADMIAHSWKRAEEFNFLADMHAVLGERATAALHEIGRRIDLDYAGIDFSLLPDGNLLFFEANATMLVHPEEADGPLATKNPFIFRILDAFESSVLSHLPAPVPGQH